MSLSTLLAALALVTAGVFVALAFTGWGRRRPLHRYGALSVAAHLLLLAGLASVRTGGPPSPGSDDAPPVRVSLVMRTTAPQAPEAIAEHAAPIPTEPKQEPLPPTPVADTKEPIAIPPKATPADPVPPAPLQEPVAAPIEQNTTPVPLAQTKALAAPLAEAPPKVVEDPKPPEPAPPIDQPIADPEPPSPAPPQTQPIERAGAPADPVEALAVAASPLAPSAYNQRGARQRRQLSADQGGSQETLDAVAAGVDWLARSQRADGAWDARAWGAGRETRTLGEDRQNAGAHAETGLTGLALLAMGGAGHTHLDGPYRDTVTRGLQFLLDQQADNGSLAGDASLYAQTYCHSMATFALAEAMAVTNDDRLRPAVRAAVRYLEAAQNPAGGSWRYRPGERGDMSQMGWAVMALRSAEIAGIPVAPASWNRCERFVESVRTGQHGGLACYQPQRPTSPTMTAEAMYCRQILGFSRGRSAAADEAVANLLTSLPGKRRRSSARPVVDLYYWYYATLALHHHRSHGPRADSAWSEWNDAMQRAVLPHQVASGPLSGSWAPDTKWGGYGGRVYSTALATMCLEVYYRYDPNKIGRDPWIAARTGVLRR